MKHLYKYIQRTWLMLCLGLNSIGAMAQVPQFFYTPPGTTVANNIPTGSATNKRQCVYYPSDFGSANPGYITKLYIKISAAATATYTDLTIKLGTAPSSYLTFTSATQAWLATDTVFYAPSVLLSTNAGNWYEITLPTPYYYNNTSNLIFEFSQNGYTTSYSGFYASSLVTSRSIYGLRTSATAATLNDRLWQIGFDLAPSKAPNNASISDLVSPVNFCAGNKDIAVRLKNKGKNIINNVTIQWALDNVLQTPISWTSPLDTVGGSLYKSDTVVKLATAIPFTSARTIRAWSEFPNSVADTVNNDDTIYVTAAPALNGSFTIGGASPDYADIGLAVNALNSYGVCGPVVFTVDPTTAAYGGTITFDNITGSSATNTITFKGNGRTITSPSTTAPTVRFNGVSYITFDSFVVVNTSTAAGFAMHIGGASHHLTITNNIIEASTTSTTTTCGALIVSGSIAATTTAGNNAQYLTITNNTVIGGYYNFTLMGNAGYLDNYGHYIANNTFKDFYLYGVYLGNADTVTFINNDINRATRGTVSTLYGIYLNTSRNLKIQKNRLHDFGVASYSAYPFYIVNCVNSVGYETEISNNAVYKVGTTAIMYGIYSLTTAITGFNFYHNTIQHEVPVSSTSAIRGANFTVAITNVNFKNNTISITGGGTGIKTGIYVTTASATFISNNNVINVNTTASNNVGFWAAANVSLVDWRTASGQDLASVSADPVFMDLPNGDLRLTAAAARAKGAPLGIITDIVGTPRSTTKPDAGAFESIKSNDDAGVQAPENTISCSVSQPVRVKLTNYGKNKINTVTVNWSSNGITQSPFSVTFPVDTAGSPTGGDTTIVIGTIFTAVGVNDTIVAWTSLPNGVADTLTYNDSVKFVMKSGFAGGTYTVGTGGSYTTLGAALAAMPNGVCGPVILELLSSYTSVGETFPLAFPELTNPANTITLRPQPSAIALSITGSNATTIIDLNKSKYVTIDGRPGGTGATGELSIVNTSTAGATVRFINGASNNTLKYLSLTGSNATATSGVIVFSTSTELAGNNNNLIDRCNINGNSASVNCIYSLGSNAPADNVGNTITNNNIYDFFANVTSTEISGITLGNGNSNWVIGTTGNGNRFYQTAARNATSTPALTNIGLFKAIYINSATVGGCSIVGNRIGGNIPGIPGSVFVIGDLTTSVGHTLRLIDNNASSPTVANSIQGNIISDITMNSTVSNAFIAIHGRSGIVNVGNIAGNTIGSQTGTGSINIYHNNTTTGANAYAIRYEAASGLIQNNQIGSMSAEVRNASGGLQLLCIYLSGGLPAALTVADNIIGGTTQHSIQSTATSVGNINLMGICASAATTSLLTVQNNLIRNLSGLNATTGTNNGVKGIYMTGASSVGTIITNNTVRGLVSSSGNLGVDQTSAVLGITCANSSGNHIISKNTVYGLRSDATTAAINECGIFINGTTTGTITVEKNRIYGLTVIAGNTAATVSGINLGTAVTTKVNVWNNMISLGNDTAGAAFVEPVSLTGILKNGKASVIHNTVNIGGAGVGTAVNHSFAYNALANSVGDSVVNNIFINSRMNSSTGGNHYAIGIPNATNVFANYNLYLVSSSFIGLFNSIAQSNLATWKSATTLDFNTVSAAVNFTSVSDLHLTGASIGDMVLKGTPVAYVSTDIDNAVRTITPYIGADEGIVPLPVKLLHFNATAFDDAAHVTWSTASEKNSAYFKVMVSTNGKTFEEAGQINAKGNSGDIAHYIFVHQEARKLAGSSATVYYQLESVDLDGSSARSEIVTVNFDNNRQFDQVDFYPNPLNDNLTIIVPSLSEEVLQLSVTDITGKRMVSFNRALSKGVNHLTIDELSGFGKGIYFLELKGTNESKMIKLIKE